MSLINHGFTVNGKIQKLTFKLIFLKINNGLLGQLCQDVLAAHNLDLKLVPASL